MEIKARGISAMHPVQALLGCFRVVLDVGRCIPKVLLIWGIFEAPYRLVQQRPCSVMTHRGAWVPVGCEMRM